MVALGCTRLRLVFHAAELQFAKRIERKGSGAGGMKSNKSAAVISKIDEVNENQF